MEKIYVSIYNEDSFCDISYVRIEQNWIDFDKYNFGNKSYIDLDYWVNKCLENLNPYLRDLKLIEIGI